MLPLRRGRRRGQLRAGCRNQWTSATRTGTAEEKSKNASNKLSLTFLFFSSAVPVLVADVPVLVADVPALVADVPALVPGDSVNQWKRDLVKWEKAENGLAALGGN
jgi:hypothetical protein